MTTETRTIRVADWTETPGARYKSDGPFSGEEYRDEVLTAAFTAAQSAGEKLVVDLDGPEGYATSFLEEAFGGLARSVGIEIVLAVLQFKCTDEPTLGDEIIAYVREANKPKNV